MGHIRILSTLFRLALRLKEKRLELIWEIKEEKK